MDVIEIKDSQVLGAPNCKYIASVSPASDGYWVSFGYPNEQGMLIDSEEWPAFMELIQGVDNYLKEHYNG